MAWAVYNENEPYVAQWIRNLIGAKLIAPGFVDERSIVDVRASDYWGFAQAHLFAGIGGWSHSLRRAGWSDERRVVTFSCPCQPFSVAGQQRGFDDDRHLWPHARRLVGELGISELFGEQVASAAEWLRLVRSDLEALGFAVGCLPVEAASAGAFHLRDRFWIVARHMGLAHGDGRVERRETAEAARHGNSALATGRRDGERLVADGAGEQVGSAGQPRQRGDVEHDQGQRRGEGRTEPELWSGRDAAAGAGGEHMADDARDGQRRQRLASAGSEPQGAPGGLRSTIDVADRHDARSQGRLALSERAGERVAGTDGMADAERLEGGERHNASMQRGWALDAEQTGMGGGDIEWRVGADGKARPVKSGIRLLSHGVSGRMALVRPGPDGVEETRHYSRIGALKGFGNAIDPRPASEFVKAAMMWRP